MRIPLDSNKPNLMFCKKGGEMYWFATIFSLAIIGILLLSCVVMNAVKMEIINLREMLKQTLYVTSGEYVGYGHTSELEIIRNQLEKIIEEKGSSPN
jgi:hypothetical protein